MFFYRWSRLRRQNLLELKQSSRIKGSTTLNNLEDVETRRVEERRGDRLSCLMLRDVSSSFIKAAAESRVVDASFPRAGKKAPGHFGRSTNNKSQTHSGCRCLVLGVLCVLWMEHMSGFTTSLYVAGLVTLNQLSTFLSADFLMNWRNNTRGSDQVREIKKSCSLVTGL